MPASSKRLTSLNCLISQEINWRLQFTNKKLENKYHKWHWEETKHTIRKIDLILTFVLELVICLKLVSFELLPTNWSNKSVESFLHGSTIALLLVIVDFYVTRKEKLHILQGIFPSLIPCVWYELSILQYKTAFMTPLTAITYMLLTFFLKKHQKNWIISSFSLISTQLYFIIRSLTTIFDPYKMSISYTIFSFIPIPFVTIIICYTDEKERRENYLFRYNQFKATRDLEKLTNQLKREMNCKERFFAGISHDLKTPLTSLLGTIELIKQNKGKSNPELLNSALFCGETLLTLIGNILDSTKLEEGKLKLVCGPTDIKYKIKKVISMFKIMAEKKGISLEFLPDLKIPFSLQCDMHKLNQVLINIIGNAVKFTSEGSVFVLTHWLPITERNISPVDIKKHLEESLQTSSREDMQSNTLEDVESVVSVKASSIHIAQKVMKYQSISPKSSPALTMRKYSRPMSSVNDLEGYFGMISKPTGTRSRIPSQFSPRKTGPRTPHKFFTNLECNLGTNILEDSPNLSELSTQFGDLPSQGILKLEVIDTGIGLSEEEQNKLFKPFSQANTSTSHKFGGTGLGLWISKEIVNLMGGNIKIESEVGEGTNFIISIPLTESEQYPIIQKNYNLEDWDRCNNKCRGFRCLNVEPNISNQELVSQILFYLGFEYDIVTTGLEAINLYKQKYYEKEYYDLIITELKLPVLNGLEMIQEIKNFENRLQLENKKEGAAILIISSDMTGGEEEKCFEILGTKHVLRKPVSLSELCAHLDMLTNKRLEYKMEERKELVRRKVTMGECNQNTRNTILVVEDDTFVASIISQFVQSAGYSTINAYTIAQAFEIFQEHHTNIRTILLDDQLPDDNGKTAIRVFRKYEKEEKLKKIPIIINSGWELEELKTEYREFESEISKFLSKPISKEKLIKSLLRVISADD